LILYIAVFNLLGPLTFSFRAAFPVVFTVSVTLVVSFVLTNYNYNILSHYCPELLSEVDYESGQNASEIVAGGGYSFLKGGFAFAISVIESFGVGIRAISLALRIVANLACGHILLTLYIGSVPIGASLDVSGATPFRVVADVVGRLTYVANLVSLCNVERFLMFEDALTVFMLAGVWVSLMFSLVLLYGVSLLLTVVGPKVLIILVGLCLGLLETLVCMVQAYVFCALSLNYSRS